MKKTWTILSVSLTVLAASGCVQHHPAPLPPGQYDHSSKATDQYGTERTNETTTNVYYDEYGNRKVTVDKKTTTDPEGLFNKTTTETHRQAQ